MTLGKFSGHGESAASPRPSSCKLRRAHTDRNARTCCPAVLAKGWRGTKAHEHARMAAANGGAQKKNGDLATGGLVRFMTRDEVRIGSQMNAPSRLHSPPPPVPCKCDATPPVQMHKLQEQEGMIDCVDNLGAAEDDFYGRDMQFERELAQTPPLEQKSKPSKRNGGGVAKFAIKEGGKIHMVTLDVAVEKLRVKEQVRRVAAHAFPPPPWSLRKPMG